MARRPYNDCHNYPNKALLDFEFEEWWWKGRPTPYTTRYVDASNATAPHHHPVVSKIAGTARTQIT